MTFPQLPDSHHAFLAASGWTGAACATLPADASTRNYTRLSRGKRSALLMHAPPNAEDPVCPPDASDEERMRLGWNACARMSGGRIEAFAGIAAHLQALGLSAPEVMAADMDAGLALIEDLGQHTYARQIADGADETKLYSAAAQALAVVQRTPIPDRVVHAGRIWPILDYDALAMRAGADLFADWAPRLMDEVAMDDNARAVWDEEIARLVAEAMTFPRALTLRDFHAENLIWMADRHGAARVGLLDFQDAVAGWGEWDVDMLIHDARRPVGHDAAESAIAAWLDGTGGSRHQFDDRITVLGTLNALRIVGVFCRLILRDGKTRYRAFLTRQIAVLCQSLDQQRVSGIAAVMRQIAPAFFRNLAP